MDLCICPSKHNGMRWRIPIVIGFCGDFSRWDYLLIATCGNFVFIFILSINNFTCISYKTFSKQLRSQSTQMLWSLRLLSHRVSLEVRAAFGQSLPREPHQNRTAISGVHEAQPNAAEFPRSEWSGSHAGCEHRPNGQHLYNCSWFYWVGRSSLGKMH